MAALSGMTPRNNGVWEVTDSVAFFVSENGRFVYQAFAAGIYASGRD